MLDSRKTTGNMILIRKLTFIYFLLKDEDEKYALSKLSFYFCIHLEPNQQENIE